MMDEEASSCRHEGIECEIVSECSEGCTCADCVMQPVTNQVEIDEGRRAKIREVLDGLVQRFGYANADDQLAQTFYKAAGL